MLTQGPPAASQGASDVGRRADDMSGRAHRQAIGYFGLALPIVLILIDRLRPYGDADPWFRDSISAYYYTGAAAPFVGILVALGLFLFTYRGYGNELHWADRTVALIASFAAFGVAFFPVEQPEGLMALPWWRPAIGVAHYVFAVVLFAMFAVFTLWLFRRTSRGETPAPDKRRRNLVYLVCGLAILGAMAWAGFAGSRDQPIFWPEALALVAFATSWLVKGRVHETIAGAARALTGKRSRPVGG